jgi:DNA-binding GntR family transcriptional regulator
MGIRAVEDHSRMKQVIEEHHAIFSGLKEGNPQKAYSALIDHLDNTEKILIENINK